MSLICDEFQSAQPQVLAIIFGHVLYTYIPNFRF